MKKYLIALICLISCFSCVTHKKEVIAKSTIKIEGNSTNIGKSINSNGFYYYPNFEKNENLIFFDDGSMIKFYSRKPTDIKQQAVKLSDYAYYMTKNGKEELIGERGVYTIKHDTIIVRLYQPSSLLVAWTLHEERYIVINRESIKRIYVKDLLKVSEDYYKTHSPWKDGATMKFTSADSIPSSDNWLKEKKWIWRNETDWKEYMERIKQDTKK